MASYNYSYQMVFFNEKPINNIYEQEPAAWLKILKHFY